MDELTDITLENLLEAVPIARSHFDGMRLGRLRQIQPLLRPPIAIFVDCDGSLQIYCSTPAEVDRLLASWEQIKRQIWLVMGCWHCSIWFAEVEVWSELTQNLLSEELESSSIEIFGDGDMTHTIDTTPEFLAAQTTTASMQLAIVDEKVPIDFLAAQIAGITGTSAEAVIAQILAAKPDVGYSAGRFTVAPGAGDVAIDAWATQLKAQLRDVAIVEPSNSNGKAAETLDELIAADAAPKTSTAKKAATQKTAAGNVRATRKAPSRKTATAETKNSEVSS